MTDPTDPYSSRTDMGQTTLPRSDGPGPDPVGSASPSMIGRYRVVLTLGRGGFGQVYLAHDDDLDRPVAIKVPNPERIARPEDVEAYLAEARNVARLDHPHIVPVYDVGRTVDGLCYVVSKYIEGTDLASKLKEGRIAPREAAGLVAEVAGALHHAHVNRLVHRDVKPANILIDASGKPSVADFGLALRDEDAGTGARFAGTPAYMSPEQARGEGHRVDGRSDIFSLGVVFYELLTGSRPFHGDSITEVLEMIAGSDARPPRLHDTSIPRELERICLKALARRASERYATASDMAEDLRAFLAEGPEARPGAHRPAPDAIGISSGPTTERDSFAPDAPRPESESGPIRVVPKGLRAFDERDADFFLELLPGPRDRDGLPDSIRFWKARVEEFDADRTFRVGLIYGPSGCGKSSLVKAGLLPRLGPNIRVAYVEATPDETGSRLLRGLRKACPDLPADLGLVESMAAVRRGIGQGRKVLVVLDQFEQWLFARGDAFGEVADALRQADGEHLQAIVMVRDDFWLAASRFMREVEVDLHPDRNIGLVDLYDPRHARKVLRAFGTAFGAFQGRDPDDVRRRDAFLDQAVAGLAQEGRVVSVRLALFAEMFKGRAWDPETLKAVGGTEGVGVTFLEETFASGQANPKHRIHRIAAQEVLKALLPEAGTELKGQMRSEAELRGASGYDGRPRDFDELIRILDGELRLITPTDPEGTSTGGAAAPSVGRYYQLTHDYLVPSLREWLTRKRRETRRGRAGLRLAERAALWGARPENRHLPSFLEWAGIRAFTRSKDWTPAQRRMIGRAERFHGLRAAGLAAVVGAVAVGFEVNRRQAEAGRAAFAGELVDKLARAGIERVPASMAELGPYRRWADPALREALKQSAPGSRSELNFRLALLPVDPSQADPLLPRLLAAGPGDLPVLRDALAPYRSRLIERLWSEAGAAARPAALLPQAAALALYDPDGEGWSTLGDRVARAMVEVHPLLAAGWLAALRPARGKLAGPLARVFRDRSRPDVERLQATVMLADYAGDEPDALADLLMDADDKAFRELFPAVEKQAGGASAAFRAEIDRRPEPSATGDAVDRLIARQARAAIALIRLGEADRAWPLLAHSPDPRLRTEILNALKPMGVEARAVASRLREGPSPAAAPPGPMESVLFDPETSIRRALILALGIYGPDAFPPTDRMAVAARLKAASRDDPDAGVHGAAAWALARWKSEPGPAPRDGGRWLVDAEGRTFAVIDGPVDFRMGSRPTLSNSDEPARPASIPRRFAIATTEVTNRQFARFAANLAREFPDAPKLDAPFHQDSFPRARVSWFMAAAYCNWLSEAEGLPRDQWCFEPDARGRYAQGMTIPADALTRKGYRLPTEAEWEYACRAGAETLRYYGDSIDLLPRYARSIRSGGDRPGACGDLMPNDLGLFDMLGNVFEWNLGRDRRGTPGDPGPFADRLDGPDKVDDSPRAMRGGGFDSPSTVIRSASRTGIAPRSFGIYMGFRVARTLP